MLERPEPAHREPEPRGKTLRRPTIDQDPGAVLQRSGRPRDLVEAEIVERLGRHGLGAAEQGAAS